MLEGVAVAVLGVSSLGEALVRSLEAAGAQVERWAEAGPLAEPERELDAIVFAAGREPERLFPIAQRLRAEPSTRAVARLVVVDGATSVANIAAFGACVLVSDVSPETVPAALVELLAPARRARSAQLREPSVREDRSAADEQIEALCAHATTLAHETRALFGIIMGYACNLRDGLAGPIGEMQRQHALNIIEASNDAAALIERYATALRPSRRGADGIHGPQHASSNRRFEDLGELVDVVTAMLAVLAARRRVRLDASTAHVVCWCDVAEVKQALMNLVTNALKFTPSGGSVRVELRTVRSALEHERLTRHDAEIVVRDTGPGVPPEARSRIFDRGVRLERDRGAPGNGLGLAVVRDVAERHGGSVRVEEAPGGGAAFVLALPMDLRAAGSHDESRADDRRGGSE